MLPTLWRRAIALHSRSHSFEEVPAGHSCALRSWTTFILLHRVTTQVPASGEETFLITTWRTACPRKILQLERGICWGKVLPPIIARGFPDHAGARRLSPLQMFHCLVALPSGTFLMRATLRHTRGVALSRRLIDQEWLTRCALLKKGSR